MPGSRVGLGPGGVGVPLGARYIIINAIVLYSTPRSHHRTGAAGAAQRPWSALHILLHYARSCTTCADSRTTLVTPPSGADAAGLSVSRLGHAQLDKPAWRDRCRMTSPSTAHSTQRCSHATSSTSRPFSRLPCATCLRTSLRTSLLPPRYLPSSLVQLLLAPSPPSLPDRPPASRPSRTRAGGLGALASCAASSFVSHPSPAAASLPLPTPRAPPALPVPLPPLPLLTSTLCCLVRTSRWSRKSEVRSLGVRSSEVRGSGVRSSEVRGSGIRSSGVRISEVRGSGVRSSGVRGSGVRSSGVRISGEPPCLVPPEEPGVPAAVASGVGDAPLPSCSWSPA